VDLKQLQLITDLADTGSFSKLCAARGVAQSALSKQLSALETEFAAKLFYRTGRGVVLTEFGQSILPRIQSLLHEVQLLRDEVASRAGVPSGRVRLAIQASLTQAWVGELFRRVKHEYPRIELRLMEGFSGSIEESLATGRADVGVLARYDGHITKADEPLRTDELFFIAPAGDPLAANRTFRFQALSGIPLVLPGVPDGLRPALEEAAKKAGIELQVELEVDSLTAMKEIVAEGAGYTILSRQAVTIELQMGRVQVSELIEPSITRTLVLAISAHRPLTSAGRVIANLLRELARARPSA
jgi:LysR family transcriptional regulator, nitrogen assimilation regulatory protein